MLKEFIEHIQKTTQPLITNVNGSAFCVTSDGNIEELLPTIFHPYTLDLNSLDALVTMVRTEASEMDAPLYIAVPDCKTVRCFGQSKDYDERCFRQVYYEAHATDVPGWEAKTALGFEEAQIALRTRFQETPDTLYAMKLVSDISLGAKVIYNDNGIATTITTQKGVALQTNEQIRPLVKLRPYRIWALLMPIIILGGIYSGLFTPTEAAAIAVFYGIIVSAFVYRNMGMKDFLHVLSASASSTASILFLVANAHIFSYLLSSEQIPQKLAILMTSLTTNPTMTMFLIMIVLLIAGCFLDNAVAVILLTPIFVNVVQAMNIDICYFGVFLVFVLAIGQVTPPVGLCLFVACDIGKVSIEKISREVLPYVGGLIVTAILLVLFPQIVT